MFWLKVLNVHFSILVLVYLAHVISPFKAFLLEQFKILIKENALTPDASDPLAQSIAKISSASSGLVPSHEI